MLERLGQTVPSRIRGNSKLPTFYADSSAPSIFLIVRSLATFVIISVINLSVMVVAGYYCTLTHSSVDMVWPIADSAMMTYPSPSPRFLIARYFARSSSETMSYLPSLLKR
jgi:hypothetical protein